MPTIIKLLPSLKNQEEIRSFLNNQKVQNIKEKFHSTIWYSIYPVFERPKIQKQISDLIPFSVFPPYHFDVFNNLLVLTYSSETRDRLREKLAYETLRQVTVELPGGSLDKMELEMVKKGNFIFSSYDYSTETGKVITHEGKTETIYFSTKPHVTLSDDFDRKDLERLTQFEKPIEFSGFSWIQK